MENKNRVLKCLQFSCQRNPLYVSNNIKIDHSVIELLPYNGKIQVQEINDKEDVNKVIDDIEPDKSAEIIENEENFIDIDEEVIKINIAKKYKCFLNYFFLKWVIRLKNQDLRK
jgi:hypothetical protein